MLATITGTNIDIVKISVELFLKLKMMEKWDDGTIFMCETQNMVGCETKWAGYKRVSRKKIGQSPNKSNNRPIEIERDIKSLSYMQKYIGYEYIDDKKSYIIEKIHNVDEENIEVYANDKSTRQKVKSSISLVNFENIMKVN
jgi:hypothetical protein